MLKQIGTYARKDIEALLGTRVFLELFVKVQDEWRSSRGFVEDLDWRRQLEQLAEAQHRNQPDRVEAVVESRTKKVEDPK
jgi:GTP-binding protein Era